MSSGGALMVCGTASDVGKTRVVTGVCRALKRRGFSVAPFKGQNMALNSVVTRDGAEIGRAQGTQARASRTEPRATMNPVLLKPTGDRRSQVVVLGRPWMELDAVAYQRAKRELLPIVLGALEDLRSSYEVVVCEGAGSPAEVNLYEDDLVNLGLAVRAGIPAVVIGDIDRGGVFAHLYGTVALLPEDRRAAVRGFVVNKLRGDPALLGDAAELLRVRSGVPVLGVLPHLGELWLDAEDSVGMGRGWAAAAKDIASPHSLDVAVLGLPRISNFTDLDPVALEPGVGVRIVHHAGALGDPDLLVLPGSKSTVDDLCWLRRMGFDAGIERCRARGTVVLGICGGYQMLGDRIDDPLGVESAPGSSEALGMLELVTELHPDKVTVCRTGCVRRVPEGALELEGYEIHHGRHRLRDGAEPWFELYGPGSPVPEPEGIVGADGRVFGSAMHGLFDADRFRAAFLEMLAERRGKEWHPAGISYGAMRDAQIDVLADACEDHLDLDRMVELALDAGRPR